jgi:hypothetical protein
VGAGAAAHLQQPPRSLEAGQAGQLTREPGRQVVQGAQEVEGAAGSAASRGAGPVAQAAATTADRW